MKRFKDITTPLPSQRAHGSAVPLKAQKRLLFLLLFYLVQNKLVAFRKQEIQQSMQMWYSNPIHSPSATSRRNRTQPCYGAFSFNAFLVGFVCFKTSEAYATMLCMSIALKLAGQLVRQ